MMDARPILLVETDDAEGKVGIIHADTVHALAHEGYFVLHCPPAKMKSFRVVAPCPFTEADVEALRGVYREKEGGGRGFGTPDEEYVAVFRSIADRIEGML